MKVTVHRRRGVPPDPALEVRARDLGQALATGGIRRCEVVLNANRDRVISAVRRGELLRVSVHWSVVGAREDLLSLLLHRDGQARVRILDRFRPGPGGPPSPTRPIGRHYDLSRLFAAENAERFGGALEVPLSWGRRIRRAQPPRTLRLASFRPAPPRITVHPVLDHHSVPEFFVRFVLFHEMLHAAIPPRRGPSGRRILHGPEFRARERDHPDYERSSRWERENLAALLVRAGDP